MAWRVANQNNHPNLFSIEGCDDCDVKSFDCGSHRWRSKCKKNHACEWVDKKGRLKLGIAQMEEQEESSDYEEIDDDD